MANTVFKLRRSSVAGKQPNTSTLTIGELGINLTDKILYSSDGGDVFEIGANNTNVNVSNTLTVNKLNANGSLGTAGKVLTSNSIGGVYWATSSGGGGSVNADAQYTWTNTQTFQNTITFSSTINGTANAANYIGSLPAANVVSNSQLSGNLAHYTNTAGLPTVINNNTANDVYYVNGVTAVNVVSNSQLSANLANYTNTASFYLDTLQDVSAGGPTSGQILTWNSTTNQWTPQAPPTVVTGVTPGYYGSFYDANANQTISSTTSAYLIRVANTFEQNGITVVNNTDITFAYTGTYEIIYSIQFFNDDNAQQDINIWFYKNGNNNIGNSDSKFTVNGKSGSNKGKIIAVTPFISTFNAGDYVRLAWAATATGVAITTDPAGTAPTTPVVPGVIVTVKQVSNIISAPPGTNSQIMFNDSGVSNATVGFTFNKTTNNVTVGNNLFVTSTVNAAALTVDNKFIANSTYVYSNGMYFSPLSGTPSNTASGSVFYDLNNHALNVYNDTATPMELGLQTFARVYNPTGSTITKGTAVYIDGANSNRPTIAKAISNSTITQAKAVGVVFDDIAATSEGFVLTGGLLQNVDTRNYSAGQEIYISAVTAGALSNTDPSYPNYTAPIGYALNSALVGQIYISTENPSINLPNTSIYFSNGTGPIVSNNFQYDYTNNVLKVGNSISNAVIGYLNTSGTTTFMTLSANTNASLDTVVTNYSLGTNASSDFAAYDSNGPSSSNWIDMGINGVNWNETFWTINGPSDGYLYTGNSALSVGTAGAFPINFFTGGTLAANERMRITPTGNVGINNTAPVDTLSINGTTYLGGNLKSSYGLSSNSTGLYHSGIVNAATIQVSTTFVANSTTLNANGFIVNNTTLSSNGLLVNSTAAYVTGFVNASSFTVSTSTIANSTGVYTGVVNSTSVNTTTYTTSGTGAGTGGFLANSSVIIIGNNNINTTITSTGLNVNGSVVVNSTVLAIGGSPVVNSGGANNSFYLGGLLASGYQTTSGLSANVATLTANAAGYIGTLSAANVVSNNQLSSNLANYAALAGATFTGAVSVTNNFTVTGNLTVTGTTFTANVTNLDVKDLNITVAKGAATAAATDGAGLTVDTANIGWYYNYASNTWQSNVGITPSANVTYDLGSNPSRWANVYANTFVGTNVYGTLQTASQPNITANNTSYVGSVTAANVVSNNQLSSNLANYQTTAGLSANVATLTANNTSFVGSVTAANVVSNNQLSSNLANYQTTAGMSSYQTTAGLSANVATLTSNNTSYVGTVTAANVVSNTQLSSNLANYQTTAGLSANVATLSSNNASYLGTVAAASYVQNTDSRTLSGNLNFTGTNNYFSSQLYVGSNAYINTSSLFIGNSTVYANIGVLGINLPSPSAVINVGNSTVNSYMMPYTIAVQGGSSSQLIVGNSTVNTTIVSAGLQINYTGSNPAGIRGIALYNTADGSSYTYLNFNKGRISGSGNSNSGDTLGSISFFGSDDQGAGGGNISGAQIKAQQESAFVATQSTVATRLLFYTSDNVSTTAERLRITGNGNIGIGNNTPTDKLSIGGTSYYGGNVILGSSSLAVGLQANGGYGTAGQVLTSNGTATYWAGSSSGTSNNANHVIYANYRTVTSSPNTVLANDSLILVNMSTNSTINLPAASITNGSIINIKNINTGYVSIIPNGSDTIDGQANLVIQYRYSAAGLISTSTGWAIV